MYSISIHRERLDMLSSMVDNKTLKAKVDHQVEMITISMITMIFNETWWSWSSKIPLNCHHLYSGGEWEYLPVWAGKYLHGGSKMSSLFLSPLRCLLCSLGALKYIFTQNDNNFASWYIANLIIFVNIVQHIIIKFGRFPTWFYV